VTLIANYLPLQDAYGGPNYFAMDPNALYEIHVDNNGDAKEDISFQFRFKNTLAGGGAGVSLNIGGKSVGIPLVQAGTVANLRDANLQWPRPSPLTWCAATGARAACRCSPTGPAAPPVFDKPVDNIGTKTIPDYAAYAAQHVYTVNIPGCSHAGAALRRPAPGPVRGQPGHHLRPRERAGGVITDPALIGAAPNTIDDKNVTTLALEVHKSCLTNGDDVIGGWTTASLRQARCSTARRLRATRPPRRPAAPGCRCRAWACPWSTRWSSA
jgi:hypothetical protein